MTRTTCGLFALTLLVGAGAPVPAAWATPSYEGFASYPAGGPIAYQTGGGSGWSGGWGGGGLSLTATAPGLAVTGLASSPGAATSGAPTSGMVAWYYRDLETQVGSGSTFYLSFLLRPETGLSDYGGLSLMGTMGGIFVGESGEAAMGSHAYGLEARVPDGDDPDTDPDPRLAQSLIIASPGQTALLVLKATLLDGPDLFELFVDPILGMGEPVAAAVLGPGQGIDLGTVVYLAINNDGNWTTDEIRSGSSFAAVTPAAMPVPGSLVLLLAGFAVFGVRLSFKVN